MRLRAFVSVLVLLACSTVALPQESGPPRIAGTVHDAAGKPAAQVTIFVTEQATGIPVLSDGVSLLRGLSDQRTDLLTGKSAEDGTFEFAAPEGEYRLVAQRWGPPTQPWDGGMGEFDGLPHFGATVELFGVAPNIVVPSRKALNIEFEPQGNASVVVTLDPDSGNNETLLVISTEPPPLDPALAFDSWRKPFLDNAIGMNRMPLGKTTFLNVPAGMVYLAAFANDNWPGFGAATASVPEVGAVGAQIDLVAGWSDGHKKPGARLMPLYDKAVAGGWNFKDVEIVSAIIEETTGKERKPLWDALTTDNRMEQSVTLPDGTSAPVPDVLAVWAYLKTWPPEKE